MKRNSDSFSGLAFASAHSRVKREGWIWEEVDPEATPPPTTTTTTIASSNNVELTPAQEKCQRRCASTVTEEHDPVCGSNGQTYSNENKLECAAKRCHIRIIKISNKKIY